MPLCVRGRLLAFQFSCGGTEHGALQVMDVDSGTVLDTSIDGTRYSSVAWLLDESGFYYVRSRRAEPTASLCRRGSGAAPSTSGTRLRAAYLPLDRAEANMVFQLVSRRYERGTMIITSNKSFAEWGGVLGDDVLATAILDRLLHHCDVVSINGPSYRLKDRMSLVTGGEPMP